MKAILFGTTIAIAPSIAFSATLIDSVVSIGFGSQLTSSSELFTETFPREAVVRDPGVEYPDSASLFGSDPIPPNRRFINKSVDFGPNYIDIDYDNSGFGSFAQDYNNYTVYTFDSELGLNLTSAAYDTDLTTFSPLGELRVRGNQLLAGHIEGSGGDRSFNPNDFARIVLEAEFINEPLIPEEPTDPVIDDKPTEPDGMGKPNGGNGTTVIPLPASLPILFGGLAILGIAIRRRQPKTSVH